MTQQNSPSQPTGNVPVPSESVSRVQSCLFHLLDQPQYKVFDEVHWVAGDKDLDRSRSQPCFHLNDFIAVLDSPQRQSTMALYLIDAALSHDGFVDINCDETYTYCITQAENLSQPQKLQLAISLLELLLTTYSEAEVTA